MTYTIYQLKQFANKFLQDTYGMEMAIPLQINGRMQRTYGWFRHRVNKRNGKREPICIELNKFFMENNEQKVVLDVLKHELVHYALYMQGKSYKDGEFGFERELKRLGVVSQSDIDKYTIEKKPINFSIYQCSKCNSEIKRQRALPNGGKNYRCGRCNGHLIDKGKRLVTI